ncbi:MAG: transglutaminase-like domain-containing protein [bacterium]|jgi:transglutaminase-like putative cysteine protease|nr:transglutaminase-like domain-containing protein [bacterium]
MKTWGIVLLAVWAAIVPMAGGAEELKAVALVPVERIAAAITAHIEAKSRADGGLYRLDHEGQTLHLALVRVHLEYLADLGDGRQFACVDLVDTDGAVYDVDFFLEEEAGALVVGEQSVHKLNGQPYYAWQRQPDDTWRRISVEAASDRELGVVTGEDRFEFTYQVTLPVLAGPADLWLPLATSDQFQQVELAGLSSPVPAAELRDERHGNRLLHFQPGPGEGGAVIELTYRVQRRETGPYPSSGPVEDFLAPERLVPADTLFQQTACQVTAGLSSDLMRARALYDHVIENLRYARFGQGWGRGDALNACSIGQGNCTDFHSYFIALARALGIPARFAIGAALPAERDDGGVDGYHCWAEFHADGKWWPVDISEADKYSRLATYYFGHQPANRFELSAGRDLVVEPGPAAGPVNFLAYALLEEGGHAREAVTRFFFRRLPGVPGS